MGKTSKIYWLYIVSLLVLIIFLKVHFIAEPTKVVGKVDTYKYHSVEYYISDKWSVDPKLVRSIITEADKQASPSFPNTYDVLAIIAIESAFNPLAISKANAIGLMQILYKPSSFITSINIKDGIDLLVNYNSRLNNIDATIQSYNLGIGNYLNGKRNLDYLSKFKREREQLRRYE